jgi:NodT family efflux transporter outer membrane factor (OMF) lipoprotein
MCLSVRLSLCINLILISACALYDVNQEPLGQLPENSAYTDLPEDSGIAYSDWWEVFNDETLNTIIDIALRDNYQIAQFTARYQQAQALTKQARAIRFPQLNAEASQAIEFDDSDIKDFTDLGGALAWEVDIFNRLGYQESAFSTEAQASLEDIEALKLSLSAEIAETYYSAIEEKLKLALLRDQEKRDELLLELTELRFSLGAASAVDILQQRSQLQDTISFIPVSEAAYRVFENRLDVLSGTAPDGSDMTPEDGQFPELGPPPSLGVPSDLLLNRPDLRALKYNLIASDYRIGQAISEMLPNLTLTGTFFYNLGSGPSGPLGLVVGTLLQPLLDWGLREAQVTQNRALYEEGLAEFAQTYITAIEDVESSLYLEKKQRELLQILRSRRDVLQQTANETRNRYMQGLTDYLPVLTAVQELRQIDRNIITQERILIDYRIRLFRSIGGPVGRGVDENLASVGENELK